MNDTVERYMIGSNGRVYSIVVIVDGVYACVCLRRSVLLCVCV
jgi:hypothetical protein